MMEKEAYFAWYRLRGLGLVCLCSLVFFFGAYLANQRSVTVSRTARAPVRPIGCVQTDEKALALSFDVGRESGSVLGILDILEKRQAKATFFVTGGWVDAHPEEAAAIRAAGHELGNRGADGRSMTGQSRTEIREELRGVQDRVERLTGTVMHLFRAPFGEYDDLLLETAGADGYLPIRWNIDSEDWKDYGAEAIVEKITQDGQLKEGSIIRLHSGARYTAQALDAATGILQEQGYQLVTLSQLIG